MIEQEIQTTIAENFNVNYTLLENESYKHNVPKDSESHFKLVLVTDDFIGQRLVQRHQAIYRALETIMPKIHALALHLYTESEWQAKNHTVLDSPNCLGGEKASH